MKRLLLKIVSIWLMIKILQWISFFFLPAIVNQYSDRTGALFVHHAKQILKRDLEYPRSLYFSIEETNLNEQQRTYLASISREMGLNNKSSYPIGSLNIVIIDTPTPERSYNGKIMCQVFFAYQFSESKDFKRMKELGIVTKDPEILSNISQYNQVTLEKSSLDWRVQDKDNLLLSVPGTPSRNPLRALITFLLPITFW